MGLPPSLLGSLTPFIGLCAEPGASPALADEPPAYHPQRLPPPAALPPNPPPRLQGREGRASRREVVPPGQVWVLSCILRSTSSRLKLAAFWRCGYPLNVWRNSPTKAWAGTSRKT